MSMTHLRALLMIGLTAALGGCSTLLSPSAKHRPQQRWDAIRGRVKCQLAEQQFQGGLFEQASRTAAESVALDPSQPSPYVLLAWSNLELGKPASAQQALDDATRIGLTSANLHYTQGVILEQGGDFEAAATAYSKACELDPTDADYLVARAEALVAAGQAEEALRVIEGNAARVNDRGTVAMLAADIAGLLGANDKAAKRCADAFIAQPEDPSVAEELGRHLAREKRYEEAEAVLRPLVESSPDARPRRPVAVRTLAECYVALGEAASAKTILLDYETDHPDDALAYLLLAKAALATNDMPTALRAVDFAQRYKGDQPELWFVRAVTRWKRGQLAAAANDLQDVLQNNPNDVEAHCLLAEVLKGQSRLDAARSHFQYALSVDPNCGWAAAGLKALADKGDKSGIIADPSPQLTAASAPPHAQNP